MKVGKHKCTICYTLLILISIFPVVLWFWKAELFNIYQRIDYDAFSSFGSFFGGFIGTIILGVTLFVAYQTYRNSKKNQVENHFFQLLGIVTESKKDLLSIDKNLIVIYISYIESFYTIIFEYNHKHQKKWDYKDMLKLAYLYFFYGIVDLSNDLYKNIDSISKEDIPVITKYIHKQGFVFENPAFMLFGGYLRQLYQTVKYVNSRKELNDKEKRELIKTLRATLSVQEQFLFFINSITELGAAWRHKDENGVNLITKYHLVKNIPENYKPFKKYDNISFNLVCEFYPEVEYEHLKKKTVSK